MKFKFRKWYDRATDIFEDFDYKDFLWFELFVFTIGILLGVSTKKVLKFMVPFIAVFAAFSAFEVLYPRRDKIQKMATGEYKDKCVEYSETDNIPDFV